MRRSPSPDTEVAIINKAPTKSRSVKGIRRTATSPAPPPGALHRRNSIEDGYALSKLTDEEFARGCAMLRACALGDKHKLQTFITEKKELLAFADYDRRTALHVAASEGHVQLVNLLLDAGANPNRSDRWGGSPLDDAQRHRHPVVAATLRARGGRLGVRDHGAALIAASSNGELDTVEMLLADGATADAADYDARTALHLAASEGHEKVVKLLCASGADVNREDR